LTRVQNYMQQQTVWQLGTTNNASASIIPVHIYFSQNEYRTVKKQICQYKSKGV